MTAAKVIGWCVTESEREVRECLEKLLQRNMMVNFDWRDAMKNQNIKQGGDTANQWHQDCNRKTKYFIVWSNREQTEVRLLAGTKILKPFKPYAIILVNNYLVEHRVPTVISRDRLFARVHLSNDRMYGDISTF